MRPEEVYRIRRENVHVEQGYVLNPHGKTRAARRKVWLSNAALTVLSRRLEKAKGDYLFPGRVEGKPIVKVNAAHNAAVKRCGVARFRLYDLRHTWATRAAESGVDLVTLAAMLGHSKIVMVDTPTRPNSISRRRLIGCSSTRLHVALQQFDQQARLAAMRAFLNCARRVRNWSQFWSQCLSDASNPDHCVAVSCCVSG